MSAVTVTGTLVDSAGTGRVGVSISFTPVLEDEANISEKETLRPLATSTNIVSRVPVVVVTTTGGAFTVALTPNTEITPVGSRYLVSFSDSPADEALITVPATGPVNISALLPTT
jgi:hypothetical protein